MLMSDVKGNRGWPSAFLFFYGKVKDSAGVIRFHAATIQGTKEWLSFFEAMMEGRVEEVALPDTFGAGLHPLIEAVLQGAGAPTFALTQTDVISIAQGKETDIKEPVVFLGEQKDLKKWPDIFLYARMKAFAETDSLTLKRYIEELDTEKKFNGNHRPLLEGREAHPHILREVQDFNFRMRKA